MQVTTSRPTPPTLTVGNTFTISSTTRGVDTWTNNTITIPTFTPTATDTWTDKVASLINDARITGVTASKATSGALTITHSQGGTIILENGMGTPLTTLGFVQQLNDYIRTGTSATELVLSNFQQLTTTVGTVRHATNPANGRVWFHNVTDEVDIMIHDGTNWRGYKMYQQMQEDLI